MITDPPSHTRFRLGPAVWAAAVCSAFLVGPVPIQAQTGEGSPEGPGEHAPASLYERLGGLSAISLVVSDFVDDFIADPVIMANPAVRERKTPEAAPYIKFQVTSLVCELSGGPCSYSGLDMRQAHEGLNVSEEEWDRMVEIFAATLAQHQVPEQETGELFGLMGPAKDDIVVPDDE